MSGPPASLPSRRLAPLFCVFLLPVALQACGGDGEDPQTSEQIRPRSVEASTAGDESAETPTPSSETTDAEVFDPDVDGFVTWKTECPFLYSLGHPPDWSPRPPQGASFRSLRAGEEERFLKLHVVRTGGIGSMRPLMDGFRRNDLGIATIRVRGVDVEVFGWYPEGLSGGSRYILFPPVDRDDQGVPDLRANLQVTVDGDPVLPRDSILALLSTLQPNGCRP